MPTDFLGPTLEEVQVWLRSWPDSARAGFVLSVEVVNARLGRVLVVEDDPGIAEPLVRGLTRAGDETGSVTTGQAALDWRHSASARPTRSAPSYGTSPSGCAAARRSVWSARTVQARQRHSP